MVDPPLPAAAHPATPNALPHTKRGQVAAHQLRILVVDDLVDAAESLAMLLRAIGGYEVRTAYDGPSALQLASETLPHAVFLDIALPKLNGYRVAEHIRQDPLLQGACLIALTGFGQAQDVANAHRAGFDHHLLKPVDLPRLEAILEQVRSRTGQSQGGDR